MDWHLVQFSAVVLGQSHNPTILNPDFLEREEIVPKKWNWEVDRGQTVITPPLAVVRYENQVSVTVEPNRLQVVDLGDINNPNESRVPEIARRYVETLKHVPYTAVGLNFRTVAEVPNPGGYLREQFLNAGRCDTDRHKLSAVGLRLVYQIEGCKLMLSLDAGRGKRRDQEGGEESDIIIANANFHRDCDQVSRHEQVLRYLGGVSEDWSQCQALLKDLLNLSEK